eukprot:m.197676 g.197676  ORF g.197676 m.197676 type:complete len:62 (-) comp16826_c0_seq12:1444-1629(-)
MKRNKKRLTHQTEKKEQITVSCNIPPALQTLWRHDGFEPTGQVVEDHPYQYTTDAGVSCIA